MALLPEMPLGEHVVEDYASLSLTLKRHPLAFLRAELAREGLVTAAELAYLPVDRRLAIAGVVLIRQRPGSANGVVFITIEDETGIANLIVWPAILERFRRAALGATLLRCTGKLQREGSVIHVVAERLDDLHDLAPRHAMSSDLVLLHLDLQERQPRHRLDAHVRVAGDRLQRFIDLRRVLLERQPRTLRREAGQVDPIRVGKTRYRERDPVGRGDNQPAHRGLLRWRREGRCIGGHDGPLRR